VVSVFIMNAHLTLGYNQSTEHAEFRVEYADPKYNQLGFAALYALSELVHPAKVT
jgi:hypothetical protein